MTTDIKVGDKVWFLETNILADTTKAVQGMITCLIDEERRLEVRTNSYTDILDASDCFPFLESLLAHLKKTAVYYNEEKQR